MILSAKYLQLCVIILSYLYKEDIAVTVMYDDLY